MSVTVIRRAAPGIGSRNRCCDRLAGPNSRRVAERRAYVFSLDRGDGRNFGACLTREIASARRGTHRFRTGGNAGKHSCRERSAEAENAQLPGSCRVPGSWNRAVDCRERSAEEENTLPPCLVESSFALGSGAGSQTQQIGMLTGETEVKSSSKDPLFYGKNCVFENFWRSSVSSVASFSYAARIMWSGGFGGRDADRRRS